MLGCVQWIMVDAASRLESTHYGDSNRASPKVALLFAILPAIGNGLKMQIASVKPH
jgi:hypothetical protein